MGIKLVNIFTTLNSNLAKFATDFRHLSRTFEVVEPRKENQDGSSAMPWKRNPMKMERLNSLARESIGNLMSAHMTQQTQGLERTLDDSAGKRMYVPESFLIADANLSLGAEVMGGMVVNRPVIGTRLNNMLPFLATEEVLSMAVKAGLPRQDTHEYIKRMCDTVWNDFGAGKISENDLITRMQNDPDSPLKELNLSYELRGSDYIGDSVGLCDDFGICEIAERVREIASQNNVIMEESRV